MPNTRNVCVGEGTNTKINQHTEANRKEKGCRYLKSGGRVCVFPVVHKKQSFFKKNPRIRKEFLEAQ